MYAVIKTGGKQHKVKAGDVIEVEKLVTRARPHVPRRCWSWTTTARPMSGARREGVVTAKPLGEKKGDKVKIFKYRPKTGYAKRGGHRQLLTMIEIEDVKFGAAPKRATKAKTEPKPTSKRRSTHRRGVEAADSAE